MIETKRETITQTNHFSSLISTENLEEEPVKDPTLVLQITNTNAVQVDEQGIVTLGDILKSISQGSLRADFNLVQESVF